ncbi:hypothetical protein M0813_13484 [Anaeramoeba flamelloides]|uniref:Ribosome biogenesis protein RPF2 homolog n=1 Tax=Anaeramoeba flamelloides TaxID=1746091 RepID=A0ABQ8Z8D4_9EUKA|nr:hypothetical protein M0813_13484 [Anaeramoeba flamelloides]
MDTHKKKTRSVTIIHHKLNQVFQRFPNSIEGLNREQLFFLNCPKRVTISKQIVGKKIHDKANSFHFTLKYKDLVLFFLKKYNLFPKYSIKEIPDPLEFVFLGGSKIPQELIEEAESEEYLNKFVFVNKCIVICFRQNPQWFRGLKDETVSTGFAIPNKITIFKKSVDDVCLSSLKTNSLDQGIIKKETQKTHRALSLFLQARFNLNNHTNMNKKYLIYGRKIPKTIHKPNKGADPMHSGDKVPQLKRKRRVSQKQKLRIVIKKRTVEKLNNIKDSNEKVERRLKEDLAVLKQLLLLKKMFSCEIKN